MATGKVDRLYCYLLDTGRGEQCGVAMLPDGTPVPLISPRPPDEAIRKLAQASADIVRHPLALAMFLDRHDLETVTPADEPQQTDSPAAADVAIVRRKDHPEVKGAESVRFQLTPRKARQIFAIAASMCDAVDSELEDDEINLRITALRIAVQLYMRRHVRPNVRVDALRLFGDDLIRKDKQVGDVLAHLNSGTVDALLRDGEVGDDDGQG